MFVVQIFGIPHTFTPTDTRQAAADCQIELFACIFSAQVSHGICVRLEVRWNVQHFGGANEYSFCNYYLGVKKRRTHKYVLCL